MDRLSVILIFLFMFACTVINGSTETEKITPNAEPKVKTISELDKSKIQVDTLDWVSDSLANELIVLYNRIQVSDSISQIDYKTEFFELFPSDFKSYRDLFGYIDSKAMPLSGGSGYKIVTLFYQIESIDKTKKYNKYLDIAYNGVWNADNERDFIIVHLLNSDPKGLCEILSLRSDKEIKSIIKFAYDGPHPDDPITMKYFESTLDSVNKYNSRVAVLMKETYDSLLKNSCGHGH